MSTLVHTSPPLAPPLAEVALTAAGRSTAVELAVRQLELLGCSVERYEAGAGAGELRLGGSLDCRIDWAGPVALPLASEADVQAACGLASVHGRRWGRATPLGIDYAGAVAGLLAVQGLLAARLGGRREVRTSVAQGALLAVGQYLASGEPPAAASAAAPPFVSTDGVRFELEALEPEQWLRFWTGLGMELRAVGRGWSAFQLRFSTGTCLLPGEFGLRASGLTYRQITAVADATGVSVVPVRVGRSTGVAEPPWRITSAGGPAVGPLPLTPGALPLHGLTVVELTRRLQGPLATHLLGLLGARVVRVEPVGGDPLRGVPPLVGPVSARFHALNRGKEVVEADPRSTEGHRVIRELLDGADAFLHNLAPGKAEVYGLGAARLLAEYPGLVHAYASGWGELFGGHAPFGTDYLVQAQSGLAALVTPPGQPATPTLLTVTDVFGALTSTVGVLAALLARARTGVGQRVESSLWSAACTLLATAAPPGHTDLPAATPAEVAADARFAGAVHWDGCALPRTPWEFR
ncbi:CoA transferase [Streptomyces tateyamensis]|uniref:CoA transferase n=1 Tax=Streptomyces tateyamensis TaxID=565073 RepID=A0A2V4MUU9_9ACTN|nr:CoA transferase [Streptomyces tateyamensis]PYC69533.1 CoA transferase [Streptomyces tateyamensis]